MREFSAAPAQGTLSYTYDAAGNVASIKSSNANGVWASYTYDEMGRLGTVVDNRLQGQQTTTYSYDAGVPVDRSSSTGWDAASNLATAAYPNQLQSTLNYDTLNRLTALSTPVSSYSYTLGPTGNRTNATEGNGRTLAWTYDNIYRLTNEAVTNDPAPASKNGSVAYTLDPVGNRKSVSSSLSGVNTAGPVTFNPDDELASGQGETYDNNGNTTLTGGRSFTFDAENHLISMNQGSTLVTLLYDGDGNRVAKTVGSVTTRYLVDDLNPTGYPQVVDELVGGAVTRQYTYGLDRISENQFVGGAWTPSFYGVDGGGSVRQLTNSSGTVTDTYEYDAFGNKVNSTGTTPNNYLYRGEQYDTDLSLYYLRARYYNPVTGRFLNVDPLAGRGQRRYEYAGANPVDGSDPSGNFVLASYWPQMAPLQINISFPSWCSQAGSGTMGSDLPPCKGLPWWITISYYPLGAKVVGGHIGVAIGQSPGAKNNDTYGWAPGWEGSPLSPRKPANGGKKFATTYVGIPIHPGILRDDKRTYNDWRSPHVDLYFKVNQSQRNFAKLDFDIRMTQSGLPSSYYDLYTRNCAEFGEDILRDAGVQGVPGHEIFWPHVVFLAMQGLADAEAANQ